MRTSFLTIILAIMIYPVVIAQISDGNTEVINQYFQVNLNETIETNSKKPNSNLNMTSYANIVQIGSENNIEINSLQTGDEQVVNQTGNNNNYEYYNYYSKENSSMQVNQEGNLNSIQIFGENSLMKNAKINQKSDFKEIVVKNYTN